MENVYYTLAILGAIPTAWVGIGWIVRRTKTKTDDKVYDSIDKAGK